MKTSVRVLMLGVLALLAFCGIPDGRLEGQSTFGSARGTAMDQTGAAIPGARVTLRSLDESTEVTTNSDSEGSFQENRSTRDLLRLPYAPERLESARALS